MVLNRIRTLNFGNRWRWSRTLRTQAENLPTAYVASIGAGDFRRCGAELSGFLQANGLRPTDRVLDLGCGLGRVAMPLQPYLVGGSYDGVDIVPEMVRWNRENIGSVSPNFRFHHLDLYNGMYNPNGQLSIQDLRLPFEDGVFDVAWATSLFTHLLEAETVVYFRELSRVLRPGGWALLTFFLLDDTTREQLSQGNSLPTFKHEWRCGLIDNPDCPEEAVAFDLGWVTDHLDQAQLDLMSPHFRGYWSGRPKQEQDSASYRYQDYILVRRRS